MDMPRYKIIAIHAGIFLFGILFIINMLPSKLFAGMGGLDVIKDSAEQSVLISVSEDGFNPRSVAVALNGTVEWINNGSKMHWPASDPHPTHEGYPQQGSCGGSMLDACKALGPGEVFSFTFTEPGVWSVHDHLFPGSNMTVSVGQDAGLVRKSFVTRLPLRVKYIFSVLTGTSEISLSATNDNLTLPSVEVFRSLTYANQLDLIEKVSASDPKRTWEYLKEAFFVNGQTQGNVHGLAHIIGNAGYVADGIASVAMCDETFAYGCFHGVTEKMLLEQGPDVIADVERQCESVFNQEGRRHLITGCIHGMGHGLLGWESMNVPHALSDCDRLSKKYRPYCYDGVFMENGLTTVAENFDVQAPWKFCTELADQYHYNCARYQADVFSQATGRDYPTLEGLCLKAPSDLLALPCLQSIGYHIAQEASGDVVRIKALCAELVALESRHICNASAATEVSFQKYADSEKVIHELCGTLPAGRIGSCQEAAAQTVNLDLK